MLTAKDLEKYHQAAERILNAMDNSPVPISWHEMDRMALQSVIIECKYQCVDDGGNV